MKKMRRFALATAVGVGMVGASAHDDRDDHRRGCASGVEGSHDTYQTLQVVGLTADQRLVCFNERKPGKARAIGFVSGLMTAADGSSSFYKVSLPTGKATVRGGFAAGAQVIGIAIPLNQLRAAEPG